MKRAAILFVSFLTISLVACGSKPTPTPEPVIIDPTGISLVMEQTSLYVGDLAPIQAKVLPEDATNKEIGYKITSGANCISLTTKSGIQMVTGVSKGTGVVNVFSVAKPEICKDFTVNVLEKVEPVAPTKVIINNITEKIELKLNATKQLSATVYPSGASQSVKWYIPSPYDGSDPIATISSSGLITAKNPGTTTVTCKCAANEELTSSINISVLVSKPTGIKLSRNNFALEVGDERELFAELSPSYSEQSKINVSYLNNNEGIVSYDETTHTLKCLKAGTASIVFTSDLYPEISKTCLVTVKDKTIPTPGTYDPSVYGNYYKIDSEYLTWTDSEDLLSKLNTISRNTYNPIRYAGSPTNWMSNKDADQSLDDYLMVRGVYSDENIAKEQTQKEWQREHAFAASLMTGLSTGDATKTLGMATDFHNLFASYSGANGSRGNCNLGYADSPITKKAAGSGTQTHESSLICNNVNIKDGGDDSYEWNFEPSDADKGKLARAIFYMAMMYGPEEYGGLKVTEEYTRYDSNVRDENNDPINPKAHGNLSDLLDWSLLTVDELEYQHNESVYKYKIDSKTAAQGNRNPFVDYPELVEYCFGDSKDQAGSLVSLESTYEKLGRGTNEHSHYAIGEKTTREYSVGETLALADVDFFDVKKDTTTEQSSDFTFSNETPVGYEFSETDAKAGKKNIVIECNGGQKITYTVNVVSKRISSCTYYTHLVSKSDYVTDKEHDTVCNKDPSKFTWAPSFDWNLSFGTGTASYMAKSDSGTSFGGGTDSRKPIQTLTLETKSSFNYDDKTLIDTIWLTAHAASGKTATVKFYLDNTVVYSSTITYETGKGYMNYRYDLATPTAGKVKIEITNIDAAIHLEYIAINAVS